MATKANITEEIITRFEHAGVLEGLSNISKQNFSPLAQYVAESNNVVFIKEGDERYFLMPADLGEKLFPAKKSHVDDDTKIFSPISDYNLSLLQTTTAGNKTLELLKKSNPYIFMANESQVRAAIGSQYKEPKSIPAIDALVSEAPLRVAIYGVFHAAALGKRPVMLSQEETHPEEFIIIVQKPDIEP